MQYRPEMIARFWEYKQRAFAKRPKLFDSEAPSDSRPPVFLPEFAHLNILTCPGCSEAECEAVYKSLPVRERHRWFRSMTSSQALAASVFGNLKVLGALGQLEGLADDNGLPVFGKCPLNQASLEYDVTYLGEPRSTSIDVLLGGACPVMVECKLTEPEVGTCSRPLLKPSDPSYDRDLCDGTYRIQQNRHERCPLTSLGVLYWRYVPFLFKWKNDADLKPCPLNRNYQLVRNVLAAKVTPSGEVRGDAEGHALLVYDERNPAFQRGGEGRNAFEETRFALKQPNDLRKCSWQRLVGHLRQQHVLGWLTDQLETKYGF